MKITVTISDSDADLIRQFIAANKSATASTHGPLRDMAQVAGLLLTDVALAVNRPGSWEGAAMAALLESHGYRLP